MTPVSLEKLFPLLKDRSAFKEIPRAQRFADRQALEVVLADARNRAGRDAAIRKACHEFGYTQAQVADATGLHYSSVSKILRKMGKFMIRTQDSFYFLQSELRDKLLMHNNVSSCSEADFISRK